MYAPGIAGKGKQQSDASTDLDNGSAVRLRLIEEVSSLVDRAEDGQEALEAVVRKMSAATDCEVCSLYSFDPAASLLSLAATHGLPTRSIGRVTMSRE